MMLSAKDYTYLNESKEMLFWGVGFVIGIIVAVIFTVLIVKDVIYIKDDKTSNRVIAIIFAFAISFFTAVVTLCNLNYSLDTSKQVECSTKILKKDIDTGRRRPTEYIFIANVDGKERKFYVPQSIYYSKKVGDKFSLHLYQGALGADYYIYVRK